MQTGWGRTGGKWFGIEQYGVKPDIVVAAKSLGNGHPIGLTMARKDVADSFTGATIATFGGIPIDANAGDPVDQIREATDGKGVDVSIELVGSAVTMGQAVGCLGVFGRAALVGLTAESLSVLPYPEVINKEAEIIGVSDHLATELPLLMQFARNGKLCFPEGTLRSVGLDAAQINAALDAVVRSTDHIRTVIVPTTSDL